PALVAHRSWKSASVVIGLVWGLWHLPVVDFLGAATPHAAWRQPFALAFVLMVSGLRVIVSWAAVRTDSLVAAQLLHLSSTGCLVMLGPPHATAAQEACWYAVYGALLWIVAAGILVSARDEARSLPWPAVSAPHRARAAAPR